MTTAPNRLFALVLAVLFAFGLGCMGGGGEEAAAEIEALTERLAETEAALMAAGEEIDRYQACDCDCEEEVVPPSPVRASPDPVPTSTPAPAATGPGEIEVKATSAVKILLDGKGMSYNIAKSAYIAKDVDSGPHLIEVQNALRKVTWSDTIDVVPGKRIRFQHGKGGLEALGTVDM